MHLKSGACIISAPFSRVDISSAFDAFFGRTPSRDPTFVVRADGDRKWAKRPSSIPFAAQVMFFVVRRRASR